jgi:hypothetical protein
MGRHLSEFMWHSPVHPFSPPFIYIFHVYPFLSWIWFLDIVKRKLKPLCWEIITYSLSSMGTVVLTGFSRQCFVSRGGSGD